jgi:hypothetical protein
MQWDRRQFPQLGREIEDLAKCADDCRRDLVEESR